MLWRNWFPGVFYSGRLISGVSYSGEIDSPGYHTLGDWYLGYLILGRLILRGIIIWEIDSPGYQTLGDWLPRVSDSGEIDSLGYHTLGRLNPRGIRPWGDWLVGIWPWGVMFWRIFLLPGNETPGCQIFELKIWIIQQSILVWFLILKIMLHVQHYNPFI